MEHYLSPTFSFGYDKIDRNRPEGARYLAQGKAYSPPPWVTKILPHQTAALKGQENVPVTHTFDRSRHFQHEKS